MSNVRQKAKDLMTLALDDRTPEKEAASAAFRALALIEKNRLLDSPLDGILGGLRESDNETVKAVSNIVRKFTDPETIDDFKTVARRGRRAVRRRDR